VLLQMKDVQKSIGVNEILTSVSFLIEEKEKAALVGVNGAGKTSVFRLITGQWQPDDGNITKRGDMKLGYMAQLAESDDAETHTLYEELSSVFADLKETETELRNLESTMSTLDGEKLESALKRYDNLSFRFKEDGGYEQESRLKGVLRGLGFSEAQWQQPIAKFSGGERTRAQLGKLLLQRSDLLLLDEPTNHLDIESVIWLEDYLRNFPAAVLLISHDRYFIDKIATKTIEIENKKSVVYNGNYSFFQTKKATDLALAQKAFNEQQKVIRHHEDVAKKIRSFRTEAALIRAKSREKMLDKIERIDAPENAPEKMRLRLSPSINSGSDVLFAEDLSMSFGEKNLFAGISLDIKRGDKIALIGANGIGKTTLFRILAGKLSPQSGRIREGVNVRTGYYDQSHTFSPESQAKTIFDEIADTYPTLTQTQIRTTLASFMFKGDDVFKPISALSGGELGRVQLSKIMLAGANFLILDEPTNHLDIFSKEILEDALREFSGTVICISHDRYFINNVATKIFELTASGIKEFVGNYDFYMEKRSLPETPVSTTETSSKEEYRERKEREAQIRRKKSRIEKLETQIAQVETEIANCDRKLETDEVNRNAEAAQAVFAEKTEHEATLAALYDEWENLNEE